MDSFHLLQDVYMRTWFSVLPMIINSSSLESLPPVTLPLIPHLEPLVMSQALSEPAGILPVTAAFRAVIQLCLRSEPSQEKVWVVLDWLKQKQGWPWSSWGESSTLQPSRRIQDRGFSSWRYWRGGGGKDVHNGTIWSGQTSFNRIALFSYKKKLLKNKYTVGPDC